MSNIIDRLRNPPLGTETSERNLMVQAADEIEKLSDVLTWYEDKVRKAKWGVLHNDYGRKARAVLENKDD